jgi:hypothetical protein
MFLFGRTRYATGGSIKIAPAVERLPAPGIGTYCYFCIAIRQTIALNNSFCAAEERIAARPAK